MNNKIKELAKEAGFIPGVMGLNRFTYFDTEKFAELVRADEREACALIVETKQVPLNWNDRECFAKAIRARSEK